MASKDSADEDVSSQVNINNLNNEPETSPACKLNNSHFYLWFTMCLDVLIFDLIPIEGNNTFQSQIEEHQGPPSATIWLDLPHVDFHYYWPWATPAIFGLLWHAPNWSSGWYLAYCCGHNLIIIYFTWQNALSSYIEQIILCRIFILSSKDAGGIFEVAKLIIAFFDLAGLMVFNKW